MKKYPTSPFPTTLHIESKFIDQALNAPPLEATRGTEDVDDTIQTLMFIDAMMTEEGNLISEVVLHRSLDRPDEADIEVKITSDWQLPSSLLVVMTWNASQRTAPLSEDGSAFIRNVPIHTLISPDSGGARSDVIITFESA